jgi:hypothetical protein
VLPAGPSSLKEHPSLFTGDGRINLLAFVGSVEAALFRNHLTIARFELVQGLLRLEQQHAQSPDGNYQHLLACPLLNHPELDELITSRYHDTVSHQDYDQLSARKLGLTLTLYASSHFVLSVAGDVNIRQSIYDAWYMGGIPVVHEPNLASLKVMYGGHIFPTLDDVRAVVLAVPTGATASYVMNAMQQTVSSGQADVMREAIRTIVDDLVYRADVLRPDALTWALGVLAWRDAARRRGETVDYPAIPNDHMWPSLEGCLCEGAGVGRRSMRACVTEYCYQAKTWFDEPCTPWEG